MSALSSFLRSAALAVTLAASCLLFAPSALADGQWYPGWLPCEADGTPVTPGMISTDHFVAMTGTLTGSASGSQSVPEFFTGRRFYYPNDTALLQPSGSTGTVTQLYDPYADSSFSGMGVASYNGVFYGDDGPDTPITSNISGSAQVSLNAHFLWNPGYDSDNPPSGPPPLPPATASFLLRTRLTASYGGSYSQSTISPDPTGGLSAQATVQDDVFNEQAHVVLPPPPYAYSYGNHNALLTQSAGGLHLVTSAVQMVGGKGIYTITLSGASQAQAADSLNGTRYPGSAHANTSLDGDVKLNNIHLTSPDPNSHPEAGNDRHRQNNQFVYGQYPASSAHDQAGPYSDPHDLCIPITVTMAGASPNEMQWLKDHMEITVTPAIPNASDFDKVINGNQITLESRYTVFNAAYPGFGDLVTYNGFLAHDLPDHNSDFGNHQVTLAVDGQVIDVANIQTFFQPLDSTHPFDLTGPTRGVYMPNFYYYYNQVYQSPGEYISWSPSGTSYTDHIYPFQIHFADDSYNGYSLPVFDTGPILTEPGPIRWVGNMTVPNGILGWVHTCAHEKGHQDLLQEGGVYDFSVLGIDAYSHDGDNVYDPWEATHGLNNTKSDSTGAYGGANEPGDNELLADIAALPAVYANVGLWNQDWANTGIQYGFLLPAYSSPSDALFDFQAQVAGKTLKPGNQDQKSIKSVPELLSEFPGSIVHGGLP